MKWILLLTLVGACVLGCGRAPDPPRPPAIVEDDGVPSFAGGVVASADSEESPLSEFQAIAQRLENSNNRYLGRQQVAELEELLKDANASRGERLKLQLRLCWNYLRLGKIEEARETIDGAFALAAGARRQPPEGLYFLRAIVNLRDAEVRNCITRHNRECCLFPLQGGGVHQDQQPIQAASEDLLQLLKRRPGSLDAAWLLNITQMAMGQGLDSVPAKFRLPGSLFESNGQIGRFRDVAPDLGVDTFNLCGGAIAEDFNGDGYLDLVTSTYDPNGPVTYYQNLQGKGFKDESITSRLDQQLGGLNCVAADYDNDGDMDVLVLRGAWLGDDGQIRNSLLENDGQGRFTDVTAQAGLARPARPTQAAVWGDYDNDGDLDLYIGNESRVEFESGAGDYPSQLFRNNGDRTFTDIATTARVTNDRYCKGVTAGDYDNDGDLDLYVSNRGRNRLFRNDGNMSFTDVAPQVGTTEPSQQSFACWFFDYDNDGWLDLFVAAFQATNRDVAADYFGVRHQGVSPCLYHNRGDGTFEIVTKQAGLDHAWLPMGANFGDLDNDGFLDVYLTTGRPDYATLTPNVMLRNDRGQRFQDVTFAGGFGHLQKGHGVAFADIDEDGDQDIYHQLGGFYPGDKFQNVLFLNPGHDAHFLKLQLVGTHSNRQAVGARIRVVTEMADGRVQEFHRAVGIVSSFGGSPIRQEIGLGQATVIRKIDIQWPTSGTEQSVQNVPLDTFIRVTEGRDGFGTRSVEGRSAR